MCRLPVFVLKIAIIGLEAVPESVKEAAQEIQKTAMLAMAETVGFASALDKIVAQKPDLKTYNA